MYSVVLDVNELGDTLELLVSIEQLLVEWVYFIMFHCEW